MRALAGTGLPPARRLGHNDSYAHILRSGHRPRSPVTLAQIRNSVHHLYYGWWIAGASAVIILVAAGVFYYGFGLLVDPLRQEFGWSTLAVAAAFSVRSEVSAVGAPLVGVLVDRFGPRAVIMAGVVAVALGFLALSMVGDLVTFYAAIIFIAIGTNFSSSQPATVLVARWFRHNRSRALTVLAMGGGLSGLTVPAFAWAITNHGWRTAILLAGAATLVICLPLAALLREAPSPGVPLSAPNPAAPAPRPAGGLTGDVSLRRGLRTRAFWCIAGAYSGAGFGAGAVFSLLVPGLVRSGVADEAAALAAAAIPVLSLSGRLCIGLLGDARDKRMLLAVSFGLQAVALALLAIPSGGLLLPGFVVLFSVGYGGPIPLRTGIQAEYFGVAALGSIQGMLLFVTSIGTLLGPVTVGLLVDLTGEYYLGFLIAAIVVGVGALLPLAIPSARDTTANA